MRVDGGALHTLEWGRSDAPPILMVHGMRGHARWFSPVGPALAERYRALSLDLRGHGESDHISPYSHEIYANDIAELVREMGLERPILLGHSMGGSIMLRAAVALGDRVRALVLVDASLGGPPHRHSRSHEHRRRWSRRGQRAPRVFANREEARARFKQRPGNTVAPPDLLDHMADDALRALPDGRFIGRFDPELLAHGRPSRQLPDPGQIRCPVSLIYGEESMIHGRIMFPSIERSILCRNTLGCVKK